MSAKKVAGSALFNSLMYPVLMQSLGYFAAGSPEVILASVKWARRLLE